MTFTREDLIEIGGRVGAPSMIDGGRRLLGIWAEDAAILAAMGFGESKRTEVAAKLNEVEERYRSFGGSESRIVDAGEKVRSAQAEAKAWIRRLQAAAANAFEGREIAATFFSEPAPGTSIKALVRAMTTYTGLAANNATELSPFGCGADFAAQGRTILAALGTHREAQGTAMSGMPVDAAALALAKGELYTTFKQLARAARVLLPTERARAYAPSRLFHTAARAAKPPTAPTAGMTPST